MPIIAMTSDIVTPASKRSAPVAAPQSTRFPAIDLLRGLAVIGMILVAYAGDWNHRFTVLTHADWRGFALADMIFPSFLFCVGAVMPFSLARRAQTQPPARLLADIVRRGALLFALGLFLQLLPSFDVGNVRVMGILQRIGICYAVAGALFVLWGTRAPGGFTLRPAKAIAAASVFALAYGALLLFWDAPGCGRACFDAVNSLPAVVDRAVFGVQHLWPYGTTAGMVTYEPEGLLSTLGALVNVFIGMAAGAALRAGSAQRAPWLALFLAGAALLAAGFLLDPLLPVVKKIWTPSFALLSSGLALLSLCLLARADATARWTAPIQVFGVNATLAFVAVSLLDVLLQFPFAGLAAANLHDTFAAMLGAAIPEPRIASAAYSVLLLAVVGLLLWPLYRRRIYFKL